MARVIPTTSFEVAGREIDSEIDRHRRVLERAIRATRAKAETLSSH